MTVQVTFSALTITAGKINLNSPTHDSTVSSSPGAVIDGVTCEVILDIPRAADLQLRLNHFTAGGQTYAISAASALADGSMQSWTSTGGDAVSPVITQGGNLQLNITATPGGGTQGPTITTVTIRINKSGKPDGIPEHLLPS